jgi:hypothetical protein
MVGEDDVVEAVPHAEQLLKFELPLIPRSRGSSRAFRQLCVANAGSIASGAEQQRLAQAT